MKAFSGVILLLSVIFLNVNNANADTGFFNRKSIDELRNHENNTLPQDNFCYRTHDENYYHPFEWYRFRYEYDDIITRMKGKDGCYIFWIGKRFGVFITAYWWEDKLFIRYSTDAEIDAFADRLYTDTDYDYTKIKDSF